MVINHYQILGIPTSASLEEVRAAYLKRALEYHPDKALGVTREKATELFQAVQKAYETLSDSPKRRIYDLLLVKNTNLLHYPLPIEGVERKDYFSVIPDDIVLHIFSFLNLSVKRLSEMTQVSRRFSVLFNQSSTYRALAENRFGIAIAQGAKSLEKTWKQVYQQLELPSSSIQRTQSVAAAFFGFAAPSENTVYVPGATGFWNGRTVTVFKRVKPDTQ